MESGRSARAAPPSPRRLRARLRIDGSVPTFPEAARPEDPAMQEHPTVPPAPPAYTALRLVSWLVLALLVVAMAYAAWLSISNWNAIRV